MLYMYIMQSDFSHPTFPPDLLPCPCQQILLPLSPCSTFLSFCLFYSPLSLLGALYVTTGLPLPIRVSRVIYNYPPESG